MESHSCLRSCPIDLLFFVYPIEKSILSPLGRPRGYVMNWKERSVCCRVIWCRVWDPWLIVAQIVTLQCLFYLTLGVFLLLLNRTHVSWVSLGYFFDFATISIATIAGWCVIACSQLLLGECQLKLQSNFLPFVFMSWVPFLVLTNSLSLACFDAIWLACMYLHYTAFLRVWVSNLLL